MATLVGPPRHRNRLVADGASSSDVPHFVPGQVTAGDLHRPFEFEDSEAGADVLIGTACERFSTMCNMALAVAVIVAIAAALTGYTLAGFVMGAVLCGMAETQGRCGLSHVGTLAPMRQLAPVIWRRCVWGYTELVLLFETVG